MPATIKIDESIVRSLAASGKTNSEICHTLNITKKILDRVARNAGIKIIAGKRSKLDNINSEIISLYKDGLSLEKIAAKFDISSPTVIRCLAQNKVDKRTLSESCIQYPYNANFFDKINTEQKAYVLGFFYADGYNLEKKNTISIRIIDQDILCQIRDAMETSRPFHIISSKSRSKDGYNRSETYVFSITGHHISKTLAEKGCPQAKSKILTFPSENIVPDHLLHHFVRGYFDGDGCVSYAEQTSRIAVDIIANRKFAEGLQKVLPCESRIRHRNYTEMSDVRIGKQRNIRIFADWLYKDATIFLVRKRKKFLALQDDPFAGTKRNSPDRDKTSYTFVHNVYGEFVGTRQALMKNFEGIDKLWAGGVSHMISRGKPYKGWITISSS